MNIVTSTNFAPKAGYIAAFTSTPTSSILDALAQQKPDELGHRPSIGISMPGMETSLRGLTHGDRMFCLVCPDGALLFSSDTPKGAYPILKENVDGYTLEAERAFHAQAA